MEQRLLYFTDILLKSRYRTGISQEYIARELNVSKRTVQNWENGLSMPNFFQMTEWFRILGLNPIPYYMEYLFNTTHSDSEDIDDKINTLLNSLTLDAKKMLLFILSADHGSSPVSVLNEVVANLHCDMKSRVNIAQTVVDNYEICEGSDDMVCPSSIKPDINMLKNAIRCAKTSAKEKRNYYDLWKEGDNDVPRR